MPSCVLCSCKQHTVFFRTLCLKSACYESTRRGLPHLASPHFVITPVCGFRHPGWVQCTPCHVSSNSGNSVCYSKFSLLSNYEYPSKWLRDKCRHMYLNESRLFFCWGGIQLSTVIELKTATKVINSANHKGHRQSSELIKLQEYAGSEAQEKELDWLWFNRLLQKRERTGKEYGCFPVFWKTRIFKWKNN